jgi:hypothetical protein
VDVDREDRLAAAAEDGINALIERRAGGEAEADEADRVHAAWAESARKYNLAAAAERRREWARFHLDLQRLHSQLAEEHRGKALQLIDEGAISG